MPQNDKRALSTACEAYLGAPGSSDWSAAFLRASATLPLELAFAGTAKQPAAPGMHHVRHAAPQDDKRALSTAFGGHLGSPGSGDWSAAFLRASATLLHELAFAYTA